MKALASMSLLLVLVAACDPCAGTPSCHMQPEASYSGQFIEFPSGKKVAGVVIEFVRRRGAQTVNPSATAMSDADGFFILRLGALENGTVEGDLTVTPPPPHQPYTVRNVRLVTHGTRGDGGFLGRLMVNPYLQLIAELHDRKTFAIVPGASVVVHPLGPAIVESGFNQLSSADNGRFLWDPKVVAFDDLVVDFEIVAKGYPRPYLMRDTIKLQYRDEPQGVLVLMVGGGWAYVGEVVRRGTHEYLPGVTVQVVRTAGIHAQPDQFTDTADAHGRFAVPMVPIGDGTLTGDVIIRPQAPLPTEIVRNVRLETFDGGKVRLLGPYGYGAATILRPRLVYRATGLPVKEGTHARFTRLSGLEITPAPWGIFPDSGIRIVDTIGVVGYDAATLDSGSVRYDIEVRLNAPHQWEVLRGITVPARYSDTSFADIFRVGSWFPWIGELRDRATGAAVPGAIVEIRRVGGAKVRPETFTVTAGPDGNFVIRPEPLTAGALDASITVRTGGLYRDTTFVVRLAPTQDDTVRSLGVIPLQRSGS